VDGAGNVFIADEDNNALKEWSAATQTVSPLVSGLNFPYGVAVDGSGNVFFADTENNAIQELPRAFVPGGALTEGPAAGADALLPVLPSTQPLTGVYAPSSDQSWLTLGSVANGVVNFSFTANTGVPRTAHLTVLGQSIPVTQKATPAFSNLSAPTITYGAATTSIAGTLGTGAPFPTGSVTITLGGVPQPATLQSDGSFAASFDTHALAVTAGGYPISFSYGGDSGYGPATSSSTLTVTPATLTVTATNQSKPYGTAVTPAGTEFTTGAGQLVNGDTVTSVSLASAGYAATATVTAPGPDYPITPSGAVGTGLGNYTISYAPGTLHVIPKALTITANSLTKIYGETVTFAGTEFSTGAGQLVNGDSVSSVTLASAGAPATAAVAGSPYTITATNAQGTGLGNYTIAYAPGTLTVISFSTATTNLQAMVDTAHLAHGIQSSLDSQLQAALAWFNQGDTTDAVSQLGAFINHVSAQSGQQIPADLAGCLIDYAQRIIDAVG
jgi:hypothetical protein